MDSPYRTLTLPAVIALALWWPGIGAASGSSGPGFSWPEFQHDATHSGTLPSGLTPPIMQLWRYHDPENRGGTAGAVIVGDVAIAVDQHAAFGVDLTSGTEIWNLDRFGGPVTTPALADVGGKLVLLFTDGGTKGEPALLKVDLSTGATPRGFPARIPLEDISTSGVAVDGDRAFVGDRDGRLYCIDLTSGDVLWTKPAAGGRVEAPPAISDGLVYAVGRNGDSGEVRVVALDEETGDEAWRFTPSYAVGVGSGVTVAAGRVYLGLGDVQVHALDVDSGKERWATRVRSQFSPLTAPAVAGGRLFIMGTSGVESALYALDATTGDRLWDFEFTSEDLGSAPVVVGDTVFVGLADGTLAQIDARTGIEVGEDHTGAGALSAIAAAPDVVVAGKRGSRGGLVAFGPDPDGRLLHVLSPTKLRLGRVLTNFALAFAIVLLVLFLGFKATLRLRPSRAEPGTSEAWTAAETGALSEPSEPTEPPGEADGPTEERES